MDDDRSGEGRESELGRVPMRRLLELAKSEWRRLAVATACLMVGGAAGQVLQ